MPKRDLRDKRPLSVVLESVMDEPSLDLGARWKKDGVRRDLGLVLGSPGAASEFELEPVGNWSVSLSLCDVRISRPKDATLARRRALDFGREEEATETASVSVLVPFVALPKDRSSGVGTPGDEIISSTGSTPAHCIDTSFVEEPRERLSLSLPRLGLRTASAATSASSCKRGLSGVLGVGILSPLSPPLKEDMKLWLAVMLGLLADAAWNASDVSEVDREPSHTLGRGGTGGMAACRLASTSSLKLAAESKRLPSEAIPETSLLPLMRLEREWLRAMTGVPISGLAEADTSLPVMPGAAETLREPWVISFCGRGGNCDLRRRGLA